MMNDVRGCPEAGTEIRMRTRLKHVAITLGALLVGGAIGYWIGRNYPSPETVPPPPLETVEFSAPKSLRTPSRVRLFTWTGNDNIPPIALRGSPLDGSWTDADETDLAPLPETSTLYQWGFTRPINWKNVFAVAFVVDFPAVASPAQPALTLVNFTPPVTNPPMNRGLARLYCVVADAGGSLTLQTTYYDGGSSGTVVGPNHDNQCP